MRSRNAATYLRVMSQNTLNLQGSVYPRMEGVFQILPISLSEGALGTDVLQLEALFNLESLHQLLAKY